MEERVRKIGPAAVRADGEYVLYWIRANRRVESNHALQFAAELANRLQKPLLCYESLPCTYPYANDRLHAFTLEGAAGTAAALRKLGAGYIFDVGQASWPVRCSPVQYSNRAAAIVTDDWPETLTGPIPQFGVETYAVDSSCIVPSKCIEARSYAAYSIRPKIHRLLDRFLQPVEKIRLRRKWTAEFPALPALSPASCEIDHSVPPSTFFRGGRKQAELRLDHFLKHGLRRYARDKNQPTAHATSNLSPYLHTGYISSLEIALQAREHAREHKLIADEFLEELIVRRELAFNFAWYAKRVDSLTELPDWVRATLRAHRKDKRDPCSTPANSSNKPALTTTCGTPPKKNCSCAARFTAIIECIGARRLSSGRVRPNKPLSPCSISMTSTRAGRSAVACPGPQLPRPYSLVLRPRHGPALGPCPSSEWCATWRAAAWTAKRT